MFVRISSFHACLRISACVAIQISVIHIKWLNIYKDLPAVIVLFHWSRRRRVENRGTADDPPESARISPNTNTKLKSILYTCRHETQIQTKLKSILYICRHETQIQTKQYTCTRNISHTCIIHVSYYILVFGSGPAA